jgi:2-oxoisovalerate dehydrogenase E1 component
MSEPTAPKPKWRYMDAIADGISEEMERDERVILAGIDVAVGGGVFAVTRGLHDRFPTRVLDTPISESAIIGTAVGAAMAGMRPIVEIMFCDFLLVCLDQVVNQAAKLRYMTGGAAQLPLVIRTQTGAGGSAGAQHSQSLEGVLSSFPGLKVVMPSTPEDALGLLKAAVRDDGPVVYIENRRLYGLKSQKPEGDHVATIGEAVVRRTGADVTLVSYSRLGADCLKAAEKLAAEGIEAEVVDVRTIRPLDIDTIAASVRRTGKAVVIHESPMLFGPGGEIASSITEHCWSELTSPVLRIGAPDCPAPFSPALEKAYLPSVDRIVAETIALMSDGAVR